MEQIRKTILQYRKQADLAAEQGNGAEFSVVLRELQAFRRALDLVLANKMVEYLFRPTEKDENQCEE